MTTNCVFEESVNCSAWIDVREVFVFPDLELQEQDAIEKYKELNLTYYTSRTRAYQFRTLTATATAKGHTNHPQNLICT